MEYILTRDEYNNLASLKRQWTEEEKDKLQKLCTLAAENIPVTKEGHPNGCMLTATDKYDPYCVQCPAYEVCPHEWKHIPK